MPSARTRFASRPLLLCLLWLIALAWPVQAQTPTRSAQQSALIEALDIAGTIEVMRTEGLQYGVEIAAEMLPESEADAWNARVARIYDAALMQRLVERELAVRLQEQDLAPLLAFFDSPEGARIVALELEARRIFIDPDADAAATERAAAARADNLPVMAQIDTIIADSDLIEHNVTGSLNSNLMFLRGLVDGGASDLGEEDMIRQVWSQAEQSRADSEVWLGAFLLTAYAPLDHAELQRYVEFCRSKPGQALNGAMFASFNRMYDELSYLLGRAVADQLASVPL